MVVEETVRLVEAAGGRRKCEGEVDGAGLGVAMDNVRQN